MSTKRKKRFPSNPTPTAIGSRAIAIGAPDGAATLTGVVDHFATTNVPVPPNTWWDDLNTMYHDLAQLIVVSTHPSHAIRNKNLVAHVVDFATLHSNIQILLNDLTKMSQTLQAIRQQHAGRSGSAASHDEFRQAMNIFEEYTRLSQEHAGVVEPTLKHILEQINTAEHRLMIANAEAQQEVVAQVQDSIKVESGLDLKEVVTAFNQDHAAAGGEAAGEQAPAEVH